MSETTENQHFVPQFYLREFTIPGEKSLIWEFDKEQGEYSKVPKSVRSICSRNRYYRQVREDGVEEPDRLEHGFSRELEKKTAPLYRSLLARLAEGMNEISLSPIEFGQFCYFVGMQYTRVPSFRDKMALFMRIRGEQIFDDIVAAQRKYGTLPPAVEELLKKEKPEVTIEDWGTIKTMLEAASSVSKALMDKTPGFFRSSPNSYFVTSDNPVTYFIRDISKLDVKQIEPVHPQAEVLFPLSRSAAVVFFPHNSGLGTTRHEIRCKCLDFMPPLVEMLNTQTVVMASRYVYAADRSSHLKDSLDSRAE